MLEIELGVEHHAHVRAHPLAIADGNRFALDAAVPADRIRPPVDDDPQYPARRLAPELNVEDVESEVAGDPIRNGPDLRNPACTGLHRPLPRLAL